MLHAAAETFEVLPRLGSEGRTLLGHKTGQVFTPLKSSLVLLDDGGQRIVLLTSHFMTHYYPVSNIYRRRVAEVMGLNVSRVLVFSSHNHCCTKLIHDQYAFGRLTHDVQLPESELTWEGEQVLAGYLAAAERLPDRLAPVSVRWGRGAERRITHNRKGRRADGSTYFMREEDRLLQGVDYHGDIDDDAFVVGFFDQRDKPVCFVTQFTGHPVTAFHCEKPIVHGEYPQVACDDLSAAFGDVPVAFLQGCAGDVNSKGLLSVKPAEENVQDAERYGHLLGETFIDIAGRLTPSTRSDLALTWRWVDLPFKPTPEEAHLRERLEEVEAFLARCDAGDEPGTRGCDGLNFPTNMTPAYRKALIEPTRQWLLWALSFHETGRFDDVPSELPLHAAAFRIGDVGVIGLPCEPLLGIGRRIKQHAALPVTIPCGYMNDTCVGYVPDGPNCEDGDYVSSFYRYTTTFMPFRPPAGDALADAAVDMLAGLENGAAS